MPPSPSPDSLSRERAWARPSRPEAFAPETAALSQRLKEVVHRHPGAALSVERLRELASLEGLRLPPNPESLLRVLRDDRAQLRLLVPRRRRWAGYAPRPWVLARSPWLPGADLASHPVVGPVRESLRRLGEGVDPDSGLQMVRWERYLLEEMEVQRAFRVRAPAPQEPETP